MNKAQLIQAVAKTTGNRAQAADAVEAALDAIVRAVTAGEVVSVTGFGSLTPEVRPARTARNPQTGEPVQVAERRVVKFRPGARFQDLVAGRRAMPESGNCIQKDPKSPRSPARNPLHTRGRPGARWDVPAEGVRDERPFRGRRDRGHGEVAGASGLVGAARLLRRVARQRDEAVRQLGLRPSVPGHQAGGDECTAPRDLDAAAEAAMLRTDVARFQALAERAGWVPDPDAKRLWRWRDGWWELSYRRRIRRTATTTPAGICGGRPAVMTASGRLAPRPRPWLRPTGLSPAIARQPASVIGDRRTSKRPGDPAECPGERGVAAACCRSRPVADLDRHRGRGLGVRLPADGAAATSGWTGWSRLSR